MWQAATGSTLLTSATIIASGCALWPALSSSGEGGYQLSGIARTAINVVLAGFGMACWLHASNPHARVHGASTHHLVAASAAAAAQQAQQQAAAAAAADDDDDNDDDNDEDEDKEGREDDVARDPVLSQLTPYRAVRMCSCAYRPLAEEWDALVNMDGAFVLEQQKWQRVQQGQQDGCGLEERGSTCPGCGRSSAASGGNSSSSTSSTSSASSTSSTSSSSCYFHSTVEVLPDVGPAHHHCHAASTDPAVGPEAPSAAAAATAANAAAVLPAGHRVLVLTPSDHVLQLVARAQSSAGLPTCHESATAEAETEAAAAAPCAAVSAAQPARTEPSAWPDATASCSPPVVWHCADEWDRDPERSWAHATAPAAASPVPPAASNSAAHPPPLVLQPKSQTRQSTQPLPGLLTQPQHTMPQPQLQPAALSARPCPPPPPPPVTVVVVIRGTDPDVLSNVVADLQLVADNLLGGDGGGEGGGAKPYDVHDVNCVEDKQQQQQQQQQRPQPGVGWAVAQVCWRMLRVVSNAVGALTALSTSRPAQQQQKQQQKLCTHGGTPHLAAAATTAAGVGVGAERGHVGVAPMRQAVLAEVVAALHRQCDRLQAHGVVLRPAGGGAAATGPGPRAKACGGSTSGGSTSGGNTSGGGGGVRLRVVLTGHSLGGYLAQAVALQLIAARRIAAASTTAANSCESSATNPTSRRIGGAGGGVDAALLLALGLCERVEVEVVRCLAFDSPGLLPADLQLVARHGLVPAEMRRVLHAYMAHPNPINMLGARAVPAGAARAAVAPSAELCGRVEENGDGGRGGRAGQSAEPPRRQLLMTMYHVVAPAEDTWTYLFRIVAYDAAATCLAASLTAAVFAAGAAAAWGVARAAAGVPALSGSTEGGGAAAAAETGSADLGGGGGSDASIARAGGHSSSTKAAAASTAATAAWRGGYTHGGVASGGNGTAAGGVGPSAGVAGRATALALAAVGAARGCVRKAASAGLAALSAAAGVLQSQAQEQLQHHSTDSLALGLRGAPAGAAAVEAAAAIRVAAPTSTCAPVAPEGSPCGVCGRHGSKTGSCGSGGSINSFRNGVKGTAGARPAVVRMRSWPEWGMGVSGLRQAAVAAARVVAVPSPLCRRNIGFKCVFMSRQQHTCDAYAAEEGYERQ